MRLILAPSEPLFTFGVLMSVPIFTLFVSIETEMNEYSTGYLLIDIITVSHCTSQNVTSDGYILELNMLSFEGKKF